MGKFTGNFKYVGGNEDFDVKSSQWGWGIGLEKQYYVGERFLLNMNVGVDSYRLQTINGHDTSYSKDGEDVNPREEYTFDDANKAVNQPGIEFLFLLGVSYKF